MREYPGIRKFVIWLIAFQLLVTAFSCHVDDDISSATSTGLGYFIENRFKRQYAYVTITVPETITYTNTVYRSATFHLTYTQYAMRTISMNDDLTDAKAPNTAFLIPSPHTVTEARTVEVTATKTAYLSLLSVPTRQEKQQAVNIVQATPAAAFAVTQTVTQLSTITDTVASLVKTFVATIPQTTLVTGLPPTIITITRTVTTTAIQVAITGTTTIHVPVRKSLLADEIITGIPPRNITVSTLSTTMTEPAIGRSVKLMGRSVVVTVTETVTPTTTVVVTITITVPGDWIASTVFTGTTTITGANMAAPPASNIESISTGGSTYTSTVTTLVAISGSKPTDTTGMPQTVDIVAPTVAEKCAETVTVTTTDITTVSEAAKVVSNTMTHWVTFTTLPPPSTTTKTVTITTTSVTDEIYEDYVVSTTH